MATSAMELRVLINILQDGTALKGLLADTKAVAAALTDLQTKSKAGDNAANAIKKVGDSGREAAIGIRQLNDTVEKATSALKFLAGGFLALKSVQFVKDIADTAARAEVLSTVLHVVGNNAGYTTTQLDATDRKIQSLGITATASRQALTQFIEAELPLAKAGELAKAAQNAAVILGTDSSEAFSRLVTAVQTSNTQMLRHMGIIVLADMSYQKFATSIGKSVAGLTQLERSQAFLNATLEQTNKIQNAYTAAMGNVGKQLTSLERYTTQLKIALGNNLLPAYEAIVEELTYFLQDQQLAADGMYHQGEAAKVLGDNVRILAHAIRELLDVLLDYKREIFALVAAYAGLKIITWITTNIVALSRALGLAGAAAEGVATEGLAGLVALIGGWPVAIAVLIAAFLAWAATFPEFRAAAKVAFDGIATAFVALRDLVFLFTRDMRESNSWEEWAKHAKAAIKDVKDWIDATKKAYEDYKTVVATPAKSPDQVKHEQTQAELAAAIVEQRRQEKDLLSTRQIGTAQNIRDAEAELQKAKDAVGVLRTRIGSEQDLAKQSQGERDKEEQDLKDKIVLLQQAAVQKRVGEAQVGREFNYNDRQKVSVAFGKEIDVLNRLIDGYRQYGTVSGTSLKEIQSNLDKLGATTKLKDELSQLRDRTAAVAGLKPKGEEETEADQRARLTRANQVLETAGIQVEQETKRRTAAIDDREEKRLENREKITADALARELDILRNGNKLKEIADQDAFERGLLSINEYYDARRARSKEENKLEIAEAVQAAKEIQDKLNEKRPRTAEERTSLQIERDKALDRASSLRRGQPTAEAEEDVKRGKALQTSAERTLDIQQKILASYGGEAEAVDQLNEEYDRRWNNATEAYEKDAINAERRQKADELHQSFLDKAYQRELATISLVEGQLDARQRARDLEATSDKARQARGELTDYQANRRDVARARDAQADNRLKYEQELHKLSLQRQDDARKEDKLRSEMDRDGIVDRGKLIDLEKQHRAEEQATMNTISDLDKAYQDLSISITQASKQIADSITNSLSDAMTKAIVDFKNMGETWQNLARSVASEIVGIFTKALAQSFIKATGIQNAVNWLMGLGGSLGGSPGAGAGAGGAGGAGDLRIDHAEGGLITGPGTGTSDSIPAMVSTGEHIMPAAKTAQWLPVLEGIRLGRILPHYALGGVVALQSIAMAPMITRRYAGGGVVVNDAGAAAVAPGGGMGGNMVVSLHPDALNMTMREWLEHEVVRQQGRR